MYKVILLLVLISICDCKKCDFNTSVDITNGIRLNGVISYNGFSYDASEHFFDARSATERGCICNKKTCLKKCCPHGQAYKILDKQCVNVTEDFNPIVWDEYRRVQDESASKLFHFNSGKPICNENEVRIQVSEPFSVFNLVTDGKLLIETPNTIPPWTVFGPDKYCIDTFVYEDDKGAQTSKLDALVCFAEAAREEHQLLSVVCMLISCVFILVTVAVYCWLPELRNLHGRVLIAYLLSLFVGFVFLSTMKILLMIDNISHNCCVIFTFIIYFFLLAAFFWLNVMCFDIWWTFSGKRGMTMEKMSLRARFCAYSLYAFGGPTAFTILLASLEFSDLSPHPLLPLIRQQGCFLYGKSRLLYLYGPIVILCISNMVFFVLTALKITQIKQQTSVLKSKESATHDSHNHDKQRLLLYVKLFIVMGVNWFLEVISAIYPKADALWKFTDAYNVLIGLIIFIIFVCKRKIFRLIKKRIKERFHRSDTELWNTNHISGSRSNFKDYRHRTSMESIRTDSGSNKVVHTTII
ncbi:unnamed protein product [Colias eurytheme]|nr:unnamed protein product [Colias eurytheme]